MTEPKKMRVYVTKYALTKGVIVRDVETTHIDSLVTERSTCMCYHRPDWHETRAEAEAQVAKMIDARRKSLAKQLAALEKLAAGGVKWES